MGFRLARPLEDALRHAFDVVPKRLPLDLPIPDVSSLEQRDHKALRLEEDFFWSLNVGDHRAASSMRLESSALRARRRRSTLSIAQVALFRLAEGARGIDVVYAGHTSAASGSSL